MKSLAALGFLAVYLLAYRDPAFLIIFLYDSLTVLLMLYFAGRARRSLAPG
jgi:hypothetical protein